MKVLKLLCEPLVESGYKRPVTVHQVVEHYFLFKCLQEFLGFSVPSTPTPKARHIQLNLKLKRLVLPKVDGSRCEWESVMHNEISQVLHESAEWIAESLFYLGVILLLELRSGVVLSKK